MSHIGTKLGGVTADQKIVARKRVFERGVQDQMKNYSDDEGIIECEVGGASGVD